MGTTIDKCRICKHAFTTGKDRWYCKKSLADKDDCGEYEMAIKALEQEPKTDVLDNIRAEIEGYKSSIDNAISEDELKIEGMKEAYTDCLEIIDKYKSERDHKCHTCKHYTSGERDGSCDSYICEHYSGWESEVSDAGSD